MKRQKGQITVYMPTHRIDKASQAVAAWLEKAGVDRLDVLRSRMLMEELLLAISTACGETTEAEISFAHSRLLIRYGGDRFNPIQHAQNELETMSNEILSREWLMPTWRC